MKYYGWSEADVLENERMWNDEYGSIITTYVEDYKDGGRYVFVYPANRKNFLIEWCIENFGARHRKRWGYSKSGSIYINNIEMAMAFKLKWSK